MYRKNKKYGNVKKKIESSPANEFLLHKCRNNKEMQKKEKKN